MRKEGGKKASCFSTLPPATKRKARKGGNWFHLGEEESGRRSQSVSPQSRNRDRAFLPFRFSCTRSFRLLLFSMAPSSSSSSGSRRRRGRRLPAFSVPQLCASLTTVDLRPIAIAEFPPPPPPASGKEGNSGSSSSVTDGERKWIANLVRYGAAL